MPQQKGRPGLKFASLNSYTTSTPRISLCATVLVLPRGLCGETPPSSTISRVAPFEPFHLLWLPHVCRSLAWLRCKINTIQHICKQNTIKYLSKCGGSMRNWNKNWCPADAKVCQAGSRTRLLGRKVTNVTKATKRGLM